MPKTKLVCLPSHQLEDLLRLQLHRPLYKRVHAQLLLRPELLSSVALPLDHQLTRRFESQLSDQLERELFRAKTETMQ